MIYLLRLLKDSDSDSDVSCNIIREDNDTDTNVVPGAIQSSWPGDTEM